MSVIQVPASKVLTDINAIVQQFEQAAGPLTAMGNDGTNTTLTFDDAGVNPTLSAVIQASSTAAPGNSTSVCSGTIFVAGTKTACTAYRANGG